MKVIDMNAVRAVEVARTLMLVVALVEFDAAEEALYASYTEPSFEGIRKSVWAKYSWNADMDTRSAFYVSSNKHDHSRTYKIGKLVKVKPLHKQIVNNIY